MTAGAGDQTKPRRETFYRYNRWFKFTVYPGMINNC